ncbi:hypothetical protein N7457_002810 [Penicillium paradoxum]|uniref:uncharacterized protein n=1 Tax=Penicillium paradoxum TaxID=176176 RepID=UPI0025493D2C|nr:uncharacterized protein N7457_002810 [Penicillium paradoxum]KAJ5787820.1 hypothetical protein N7457_002810 [Penicillium paradoxum]
MAKGKKEAKNAKNSQSHIRARLDYLHQAALYFQGTSTLQNPQSIHIVQSNEESFVGGQLSVSETSHVLESNQQAHPASQKRTDKPLGNLSRVCISHLRAVALKTQIRLPTTLKRSVCKRCETILTPGVTCSHEITNASRGGKKPWADVLVVRCFQCGTEKRFPQTEKRVKKLAQRRKEKELTLLRDDRHESAPQVDTTRVSQQEEVDPCDENTPMLDVTDMPAAT